MFVPGRSRSIETEFDENDDIFDGATLVQVEAKNNRYRYRNLCR